MRAIPTGSGSTAAENALRADIAVPLIGERETARVAPLPAVRGRKIDREPPSVTFATGGHFVAMVDFIAQVGPERNKSITVGHTGYSGGRPRSRRGRPPLGPTFSIGRPAIDRRARSSDSRHQPACRPGCEGRRDPVDSAARYRCRYLACFPRRREAFRPRETDPGSSGRAGGQLCSPPVHRPDLEISLPGDDPLEA